MEQPETTENQTPSEQGGKRKGGKGLLFFIIIIIIVAAVAVVYLKPNLLSQVGVGGGEVSATVDGIEISAQQVEDRIERNRAALEAQGNDLEDPETLAQLEAQIITQLVNEQLVLADANILGITVTDEEIEEQLATIRGRFETDEAFATELENNRFTEKSLRANVERELLIQKYVQQVADSQPIEISDEEIQTLYDQLAEQNEELPALEELAPQIEDQLRNQQLGQIVDSVVTDLRTEADIVITEEETEVATETDA